MLERKRYLYYKICGWFVVPLILLGVWQLYAAHLQAPWILPTPVAVFEVLVSPLQDHYSTGSLLSNTFVSMIRVAIGFVCAATLGILLGIVFGMFRPVFLLIEPTLEIVRPLCPIAWLPFAIAVFKLKTLSQLFGVEYSRTVFDQVYLGTLFVLFWGGFFPVFINTLDGMKGVKQNYRLLAKSLGASSFQLFYKVNLPAVLPMIITGLRQGLALCWFVIIAAEMLPGSDSGIGYLLLYAADQSDMSVVIAAMIIIGLVGACFNGIMVSIMKLFVSWHGKEV